MATNGPINQIIRDNKIMPSNASNHPWLMNAKNLLTVFSNYQIILQPDVAQVLTANYYFREKYL
ncbi:hypothetical protein NBRC116492_04960 [Aurantivibrio infirmus]